MFRGVFARTRGLCYIFATMKTASHTIILRRDWFVGGILGVLAFALYLRTLAPSVAFLFDDTLEYQYVIPRLGIIHPTGYPLFTLFGKLFTLLVPLNDPAFRLNLLSALMGALAVALLYLVVRQLTTQRLAAIVAALLFAVSQTFWAQAVIAESYTTQMVIVLALLYQTLAWRATFERGDGNGARRRFDALAFTMGLGLTHHRLILLLYPAIALYVLLYQRDILRDWKTLARAAVLFIAPLSLYLYLPLRGAVGSADGTYENTLGGLIAWVTGQQYTVFLTSNPFAVQHDAAFYWTLFNAQLSLAGLALALMGVLALLRRLREWTLLIVALSAEAGFAFNYNTANVQVHFLTTFLLLTVFGGVAIDALLNIFAHPESRISARVRYSAYLILSILLLTLPLNLGLANFAANDLSQKWDVHDYGLDLLTQPLENNATIIGLGGEMTLIRYFQENQNLRPDVNTIIADTEQERLAAIERALKQNRVVYLTRPLKGAPEQYALSSVGALIRVNPAPVMVSPALVKNLDADFGAAKLLGYTLDTTRLNPIPGLWHIENGKLVRVTLQWQAQEKFDTDALVSVKILRSDGRVFGQSDHRPVLDAYPTTAWRVGEIIADTFDVPVFLGVTPGDYTVRVTLYDAQNGNVIGQHDLAKIMLAPDLVAPRASAWNMATLIHADFNALSLVGYSFDTAEPLRPGDALPLTLLWHGGAQRLPDSLLVRMWLEDALGNQVASRDTPLSVGYPPFMWQTALYVRDFPLLRVPANLADGTYRVRFAVSRNNQLRGSALLPFQPTIVNLGHVAIKNRARVMVEPKIQNALPVVFDQKIKLLGYDLAFDPNRSPANLTLYWQALAPMDTPYTVFVHLLNAQNQVVASADASPGNGALPTTGWIAEEYIVDAHALALTDVPAGAMRIEIGIYDAATGARLKTSDGQDHVIVTTATVP